MWWPTETLYVVWLLLAGLRALAFYVTPGRRAADPDLDQKVVLHVLLSQGWLNLLQGLAGSVGDFADNALVAVYNAQDLQNGGTGGRTPDWFGAYQLWHLGLALSAGAWLVVLGWLLHRYTNDRDRPEVGRAFAALRALAAVAAAMVWAGTAAQEAADAVHGRLPKSMGATAGTAAVCTAAAGLFLWLLLRDADRPADAD